MHLGISTYSFPWSFGAGNFAPARLFTYKDLILIAAKKSINFVQFGDNYPLHKLSGQDLLALKNMADELKINVQAGTRGLTIQNVKEYVRIAQMMNSTFLRMVIDSMDYHPTEEEVIRIITTLIPILEKANVKLAIENHDRFKSETLKRIIESTDPGWVGICLDTTNSLGAGEGIREVVDVLSPYTLNLHIKDYKIERKDHKMGFIVNGCAAGDGMLNIPWLLGEITRHGKCETATLELWSEPKSTIEETIQIENDWADKSIDYLKIVMK